MFTRIGTKIVSPNYVSHIEHISDVAVLEGDTVTYKKVSRFIDPRLKAYSMSVHERMVNGTFRPSEQNQIVPSMDSVYRAVNRATTILDSANERLKELEAYKSLMSNPVTAVTNNEPE